MSLSDSDLLAQLQVKNFRCYVSKLIEIMLTLTQALKLASSKAMPVAVPGKDFSVVALKHCKIWKYSEIVFNAQNKI